MSGVSSGPTRPDPRTRIQGMVDQLSAGFDGCPVAILVRETEVDAFRLAAHVGVGPQLRSRIGPALSESSPAGQAVHAAGAGEQLRLQGALYDWLAVPLPAADGVGAHAGLGLLPWRDDPDVRALVVERCSDLVPKLHEVREEVRARRVATKVRSDALLERRWVPAVRSQGGPPISDAVGPQALPLRSSTWLSKAWQPVQLLDGSRDPRPLALMVSDGARRRSSVDALVRAVEEAGLGLVTLLPAKPASEEPGWRVDAVVAGGARLRVGLRAHGDPAWASEAQDLVLHLEDGLAGRRASLQVLPPELLGDDLRQERLVHHLTTAFRGQAVRLPASLERLGEGGPAAERSAPTAQSSEQLS